jgi:hypothetical protein
MAMKPGMRAREFAHVAVDNVQAQGKQDGNQGQFEENQPVVAHLGPDVQDRIHQSQLNHSGDEEGKSLQVAGQCIGRPDHRPGDQDRRDQVNDTVM